MSAPQLILNVGDQLISRLREQCQNHNEVAHQISQVAEDLNALLQAHTEQINRLAKIGAALGAERDIPTLLEMILMEAVRLNHADGGTFYLVQNDDKGDPVSLKWVVMQNTTLKTWSGGTSGVPIPFADVPLYIDGAENHSNVSAHVALTGRIINLPDVYVAEGFDFRGTRIFDEKTGYRSKSMLVFPLRNHENEIVAVMQLINVTDSNGTIFPFAKENELLTLSLATQAAVAITNARLIRSLEELFDAFIKAIAQSIDAKDEVTGGHISRVAELTMRIAKAVNESNEGGYGQVHFNSDEMRELSIAAWLHDTGKITTPETVMFKATKLEAYVDRVDNVKLRFELARALRENLALRDKLTLCEVTEEKQKSFSLIDTDLSLELEKIGNWWRMIEQQNLGMEFLKPEVGQQIKDVASYEFEVPETVALKRNVPYHGYLSRLTWEAYQPYVGPREQKQMPIENAKRRLLSKDEERNLLISRGTINEDELAKMRDHVVQTMNILEQLPFPRKLRRVPEYAGGHHEFINGKGYPKGLAGPSLPLQSRIMALADIFEALSAADRPYKKAKPMSEVLKILGFMVKGGEIDADIFDVFIKSGVMAGYTKEFIMENQIDIDLVTGK
ncbi:MAG: HD domain-containing protein [bacterium]|nr:HD domain-containing protein [bacterium]